MFRMSSTGSLLVMATSCLSLVVAASLLVPAASLNTGVGTPGVDFPTYSEVPPGLTFSCNGRIDGYYADLEAQCQVWHWCVTGSQHYSFLCSNGTLYNQRYRVCDWWYNVDCSSSPDYYHLNENLYKTNTTTEAVPLKRSEQVKEKEATETGDV
ncbi:U-scoloptoxin(01)-Cw1a-like [Panulirus ornatus]|uniref:U-scoloptoxin(01)-Cw1a-like n=1 Tax=Panulirus ornatus TaxID=150431 RepID=UPI003A899238